MKKLFELPSVARWRLSDGAVLASARFALRVARSCGRGGCACPLVCCPVVLGALARCSCSSLVRGRSGMRSLLPTPTPALVVGVPPLPSGVALFAVRDASPLSSRGAVRDGLPLWGRSPKHSLEVQPPTGLMYSMAPASPVARSPASPVARSPALPLGKVVPRH